MSSSGRGAGSKPRVLLLWPGGVLSPSGSFGVPQLVGMASALHDLAEVEVVDLDAERLLGRFDLRALGKGGYDLIGISCYSSYDYLKVMTIAAEIKRHSPRAWLVTGGYHASARPGDFTGPGSAIDYVVVGDGEAPLRCLTKALIRGSRPSQRVLTPEPLTDLEGLSYDWSLLDRYRPVARRAASQAEIYLSRGCPFDCSFCMERAKRETSWRPLEPERAVEEIHRLDDFLDLSRWTLFVTDALFGMKTSWRRAFLEQLARRPPRARKIWVLCRLDGLDRDDLSLMKRANVAPGFGLESGDPGQLARIDKARDAEAYLDKMRRIAAWASELEVPFGANVIVGHPGETEASLRRSAAYLRDLFLPEGASRTHGFLSVDPFRLYPGSTIDDHLDAWRRDTGLRLHRYPWWHDGDQGFLSEWIDPSSELDYRRTKTLTQELFQPILRGIQQRFGYQGPARDYFLRSVQEQVRLGSPRRQLHTLGMWHLWTQLVEGERAADGGAETTPHQARTLADDPELAEVAREARRQSLAAADLQPATPLLHALIEVPRERFVDLEQIAESADDRALPLTDDGGSTLSALHAYVHAFEALDLGVGDRLVDLGGGSGYGAALAAEVVGPRGSVLSIELDPSMRERAQDNLAGYGHARYLIGSAHDTALWATASKVYVSFALPLLPVAWADALEEGGRLVVPIQTERHQMLTLYWKVNGELRRSDLRSVRYVPDRSSSAQPDHSRR